MRENGEKFKARTGARLFFWNLSHYLMGLISVNLLFFACSLPILTIGPAWAALCRVCCLLADGKPLLYPAAEFFSAFKAAFWKELAAGLIWLCFIGSEVFAVCMILRGGGAEAAVYMLLAIAALLFNMMFLYVFPQLAMIELSLKDTLKNSVLLMLHDLKRALLAALAAAALLLTPLFFLPGSFVFYVIVQFSLACLTACSFTWPLISRRIAGK